MQPGVETPGYSQDVPLGQAAALLKIPLVAGTGGVTVDSPMKMLPGNRKVSGLTLIELLVVIAVIAVLAAMILPTFNGNGKGGTRIRCISNLRQIDIGFIMYAADYGNQYPMQASAQNGGTLEFTYTDHVFPHYEKIGKHVLPNGQLLRVLVCPADKTKLAATNFAALSDLNISYFLNVDASIVTNAPSQAILMGDRNLALNRQLVKAGLLTVSTNANLNWTDEIHRKGGNLAFVDGHVEWSKVDSLNSFIQKQPFATNRFCIP